MTAEDFSLFVDGVLTPIQAVIPPRMPLSGVVLFDTSASLNLRPSFDRETVAAFNRAIVRRLDPHDRLRIGQFGRSLTLSPMLDSDKTGLSHLVEAAFQLPREERYGPSPIWDAVEMAVSALEQEEGLRVVILLTDGMATGNRLGRDDVLRHALAASTMIWAASPRHVPGASEDLHALAELTGGLYVSGYTAPSAMAGIFGGMLDTLQCAYRLHIQQPVADGQFHRIDITMRGAEVVSYQRRYLARR